MPDLVSKKLSPPLTPQSLLPRPSPSIKIPKVLKSFHRKPVKHHNHHHYHSRSHINHSSTHHHPTSKVSNSSSKSSHKASRSPRAEGQDRGVERRQGKETNVKSVYRESGKSSGATGNASRGSLCTSGSTHTKERHAKMAMSTSLYSPLPPHAHGTSSLPHSRRPPPFLQPLHIPFTPNITSPGHRTPPPFNPTPPHATPLPIPPSLPLSSPFVPDPDLSDLLTCPVCMEGYEPGVRGGKAGREPLFLHCHHSVCRACLPRLTRIHHVKGGKETSEVMCPECRVVTLVPQNGLTQNFYLVSLIEAKRKKENDRLTNSRLRMWCEACDCVALDRCADHPLAHLSTVLSRAAQTYTSSAAAATDLLKEKVKVGGAESKEMKEALETLEIVSSTVRRRLEEKLERSSLQQATATSLLVEVEQMQRRVNGESKKEGLGDTGNWPDLSSSSSVLPQEGSKEGLSRSRKTSPELMTLQGDLVSGTSQVGAKEGLSRSRRTSPEITILQDDLKDGVLQGGAKDSLSRSRKASPDISDIQGEVLSATSQGVPRESYSRSRKSSPELIGVQGDLLNSAPQGRTQSRSRRTSPDLASVYGSDNLEADIKQLLNGLQGSTDLQNDVPQGGAKDDHCRSRKTFDLTPVQSDLMSSLPLGGAKEGQSRSRKTSPDLTSTQESSQAPATPTSLTPDSSLSSEGSQSSCTGQGCADKEAKITLLRACTTSLKAMEAKVKEEEELVARRRRREGRREGLTKEDLKEMFERAVDALGDDL